MSFFFAMRPPAESTFKMLLDDGPECVLVNAAGKHDVHGPIQDVRSHGRVSWCRAGKLCLAARPRAGYELLHEKEQIQAKLHFVPGHCGQRRGFQHAGNARE